MPKSTAASFFPFGLFLGVIFLCGPTASAQSGGWCTPSAKVNILYGLSTWYPGTVRGPAPGGKCKVSYDGWSAQWDEEITGERAAPLGSHNPYIVRPIVTPPAPKVNAGGSPPTGVYDCYGRGMAEGNQVRDTAGQLTLGGSKFSIIGAGLYLSRGGATGHFTFDGVTISMTDGPYSGQRFKKVADWSFRLLVANGEMGPVSCPLNTAKDARQPNRW